MFKLFKRNGEYITRDTLEYLILVNDYDINEILSLAKVLGFEFTGNIKDLTAICKGKKIEDSGNV